MKIVSSAWRGGEKMRVMADDVEDFLLNDTRLSNIIDRVSLFLASNILLNVDEVRGHLGMLKCMQEEESVGSVVFQDIFERLKYGALNLMVIEPIYGAAAIILAKSIRVESFDEAKAHPSA
ncbi:hypothetical protein [Hydrogenophaga sp. BPS33]|uniref:hypothetical protein n=1 Tax=Hydrogenophaga sp. BPS33 TaxID=2651974 RepID=UPI00131F6228|nr:hypothetical protein [Hydrogenophaga sp. BPS33]QHE86659.1 hypothetical protein F9K07_18015 [Hydrogenophaga sp. BPS33]